MTSAPGGKLRLGGTGRGAWICAGSPKCAERAVRRDALSRALRAPVGEETALSLPGLLAREGGSARGTERSENGRHQP